MKNEFESFCAIVALLIAISVPVLMGYAIGYRVYDPGRNGYECTDERIVDHTVECYKWEKKNEQR